MNLADHDKTQVLNRLDLAIQEGSRPVMDDGNSLLVVSARYNAEIRFRRAGAVGAEGYFVSVEGPAKFVSEVLAAAADRFLDSEER